MSLYYPSSGNIQFNIISLCLLCEQKKLSSAEQESGVDSINNSETDFEPTAFYKTAIFPEN